MNMTSFIKSAVAGSLLGVALTLTSIAEVMCSLRTIESVGGLSGFLMLTAIFWWALLGGIIGVLTTIIVRIVLWCWPHPLIRSIYNCTSHTTVPEIIEPGESVATVFPASMRTSLAIMGVTLWGVSWMIGYLTIQIVLLAL